MIKPRIGLVETSLSYSDGTLWESLSADIRNAKSLASFKKLAFNYFISK